MATENPTSGRPDETDRATMRSAASDVRDLALCEVDHLILAPNVLYRFYVADDCTECEARQRAAGNESRPAYAPIFDVLAPGHMTGQQFFAWCSDQAARLHISAEDAAFQYAREVCDGTR